MYGAGWGRVVKSRKNRRGLCYASAKYSSATLSIFAGSLLSDIAFGDGIQTDDINQVVMVALIAGIVQLFLTRKKAQ
jgi:hypothetical protein